VLHLIPMSIAQRHKELVTSETTGRSQVRLSGLEWCNQLPMIICYTWLKELWSINLKQTLSKYLPCRVTVLSTAYGSMHLRLTICEMGIIIITYILQMRKLKPKKMIMTKVI
jgi:hypothetical protein